MLFASYSTCSQTPNVLRSALFWEFARLIMVVCHRCYGHRIGPILRGQAMQGEFREHWSSLRVYVGNGRGSGRLSENVKLNSNDCGAWKRWKIGQKKSCQVILWGWTAPKLKPSPSAVSGTGRTNVFFDTCLQTTSFFFFHCLLDQFIYINLPMDLRCEISEICASVFEDKVTGCRI